MQFLYTTLTRKYIAYRRLTRAFVVTEAETGLTIGSFDCDSLNVKVIEEAFAEFCSDYEGINIATDENE